jgi:hypothetical protein
MGSLSNDGDSLVDELEQVATPSRSTTSPQTSTSRISPSVAPRQKVEVLITSRPPASSSMNHFEAAVRALTPRSILFKEGTTFVKDDIFDHYVSALSLSKSSFTNVTCYSLVCLVRAASRPPRNAKGLASPAPRSAPPAVLRTSRARGRLHQSLVL